MPSAYSQYGDILMAGVLDGVRVLDFGRYIAGPYCACLLGDLGAEVIRIERIGGGEDRFLLRLGNEEGGATFLPLNRNKKSMTLEPASPEGRKIVEKLVATADIVVVNLPPQALKSLGLDYDSLRAIKPDIILTSLNAFGSGGPWSNRVGLDGIAQVMSGLANVSGAPGAPQKMYGPWADYATASLGAFGTLAALLHKRQTGQGQHVEGNLLMSAMVPAAALLAEQAVTGANRESTGNRSQTAGPADLFRTKNGWIIVQVVGQPMYKRWTKMIGDESLFTDERFKDDDTRAVNYEVINARMSEWCARRTTDEALDELEKWNLPAGPLLKAQEVLDHPQVKALKALQDVTYPGIAKPIPLLRTPVSLSATPGTIRTAPPQIGSHTDAILSGLGLSTAEISNLRATGVV